MTLLAIARTGVNVQEAGLRSGTSASDLVVRSSAFAPAQRAIGRAAHTVGQVYRARVLGCRRCGMPPRARC
jgi:hypothetical protein